MVAAIPLAHLFSVFSEYMGQRKIPVSICFLCRAAPSLAKPKIEKIPCRYHRTVLAFTESPFLRAEMSGAEYRSCRYCSIKPCIYCRPQFRLTVGQGSRSRKYGNNLLRFFPFISFGSCARENRRTCHSDDKSGGSVFPTIRPSFYPQNIFKVGTNRPASATSNLSSIAGFCRRRRHPPCRR